MSKLGSGGMGVVYKALQDSVNRTVALKVIYQDTDSECIRRFAIEAATAANLDHQHIVRVWEASTSEPPYFIAMKYLEGGTLQDKLSVGRLAPAEVLRIMGGVCSALDYAHKQGIVHRDVKPANIMFDEHSNPVITDFGIAKQQSIPSHTLPGTSFGTVDYMSPEQARGADQVDWRSDLFSLGLVLYQMIVGQKPFESENPLSVLSKLSGDYEVPMPSQIGFDVPQPLEAVLLKALAKDPDLRYQSGAELFTDLNNAYSSIDVPKDHKPVRAWWKLSVSALLVIVLALITSISIRLLHNTKSLPANVTGSISSNKLLSNAQSDFWAGTYEAALDKYRKIYWNEDGQNPEYLVRMADCEERLAQSAQDNGTQDLALNYTKAGIDHCKIALGNRELPATSRQTAENLLARFNTLSKKLGESPTATEGKAREAFKNKDFRSALSYYKELWKQDPKVFRFSYQAGICEEQLASEALARSRSEARQHIYSARTWYSRAVDAVGANQDERKQAQMSRDKAQRLVNRLSPAQPPGNSRIGGRPPGGHIVPPPKRVMLTVQTCSVSKKQYRPGRCPGMVLSKFPRGHIPGLCPIHK